MDYVEFLELSRFLTAKSWNKRECFFMFKINNSQQIIFIITSKKMQSLKKT